MESNVQVIFVANQQGNPSRFDELKDNKEIIYINDICRKIKNPAMKLLRRIHFGKINHFISLPFKNIWGNSLQEIDFRHDVTYYIFFTESVSYPIPPEFLNKLRLEYDVHYIIILEDFWNSKYTNTAKLYSENVDIDYFFSFNPNDCKKYGFLNAPLFFPTYNFPTFEIKYDLYFAGVAKERLGVIHQLICEGIENKVLSFFRITEVSGKDELYKDYVVYNKRIPYEKVLEETQACNCILEVLTPGQSGATLRYYEAICYNKKLLTNNKNVVNLPFYKPDYIQVFENIEDINWEWVKERIAVDYHYDGCFSPSNILKKMINDVIELEKRKHI